MKRWILIVTPERIKYFINNNQSLQTLLVVFCNGEQYSKDSSLLPFIAKEVYDFNKRYTIED